MRSVILLLTASLTAAACGGGVTPIDATVDAVTDTTFDVATDMPSQRDAVAEAAPDVIVPLADAADAADVTDAPACPTAWDPPSAPTGCMPTTLTATGAPEAMRVSDAGVTVHQNLTYATRGGFALQGDLYVPPARGDGHTPGVLVVVHGGGWLDCDNRRASDSGIAEVLAQVLGVVTFNVEYRLVQEGGGYPANLMDVRCAAEWVGSNPRHLPYDGTRMAITGESAGAHLASMIGLTGGRADLDPHCGPAVDAAVVVAFSGVYDLPAFSATTSAAHGAPALYAGACGTSPITTCSRGRDCSRCVDASPIAHACEHAPRFEILHAPDPYDPLIAVVQAQRMYAALTAAGATAELFVPTPAQLSAVGCAPGTPVHGFGCLAQAGGAIYAPVLLGAIGPR